MQKKYLGEFEELVLTMVGVLKEDAYGAMIAKEIKTTQRRVVHRSGAHMALYRLKRKGLITSTKQGKRIYTVTSSGLALLKSMKEARLKLWKKIPQL